MDWLDWLDWRGLAWFARRKRQKLSKSGGALESLETLANRGGKIFLEAKLVERLSNSLIFKACALLSSKLAHFPRWFPVVWAGLWPRRFRLAAGSGRPLAAFSIGRTATADRVGPRAPQTQPSFVWVVDNLPRRIPRPKELCEAQGLVICP